MGLPAQHPHFVEHAHAVQNFLQVMQRKNLIGDQRERLTNDLIFKLTNVLFFNPSLRQLQIITGDLFSIRCFIPTHKDEVGAQDIVTVIHIFPEVCHLQSWR